jgi:hypothetical protein
MLGVCRMNRLNGVAPKLEVECQSEWQRGPTAGIEIERGGAEGELRTSRQQGEGKGREGEQRNGYHEGEDRKDKGFHGRKSSLEAIQGQIHAHSTSKLHVQ